MPLVFLSLHRSKWKDDTLLFVSICIDQEKRERERKRNAGIAAPSSLYFRKDNKRKTKGSRIAAPSLSPLVHVARNSLFFSISFCYLWYLRDFVRSRNSRSAGFHRHRSRFLVFTFFAFLALRDCVRSRRFLISIRC